MTSKVSERWKPVAKGVIGRTVGRMDCRDFEDDDSDDLEDDYSHEPDRLQPVKDSSTGANMSIADPPTWRTVADTFKLRLHHMLELSVWEAGDAGLYSVRVEVLGDEPFELFERDGVEGLGEAKRLAVYQAGLILTAALSELYPNLDVRDLRVVTAALGAVIGRPTSEG